MCDTEGNKRTCIFDYLFHCQQSNQDIHLKEKKLAFLQIKISFFWKKTSIHWKFFKLFKHYINVTVLWFCPVEISSTINQSYECMEYWKYCSISLQNLSIQLKVFWYYLLAAVASFSKQTHLERYVPVLLGQSLFREMHTLIADLCLLLLNCINRIFIWIWYDILYRIYINYIYIYINR